MDMDKTPTVSNLHIYSDVVVHGSHEKNNNASAEDTRIECDGVAVVEIAKTVSVAGFENINETDTKEYLNNYKSRKTGISHEVMVDVYPQWAEKYDEDLCPGRHNIPEIAAQALAEYYPSDVRPLLKILDVAAGTGRVGHELHRKGFRHMDALEPSLTMLKILLSRGIYEKTYESSIGLKPVDDIFPNTYDNLVIAGGMGEGHTPIAAVDEMIRVVKPGGTVFIVMREECLSHVQAYDGKLEPYMKNLQEKGFWKQVSRTINPYYSFHRNGVVFNYEILTTKWPTTAT